MSRKTKTTKRGNNEGSIYRRNDGKWVGQVIVGYDADTGKPIRKYTYSTNREEVARWVAVTIATSGKAEVIVNPDKILVKDFLHEWLVTFKSYEVSSRTMEGYYNCEKNHIVPELGGYGIKDLTTMRIQSFLNQLPTKKNLGTRSITLIRGILTQMYDYAIAIGLVTNNPAKFTKIPRIPRKIDESDDGKVLTIVQREAMLKALSDEPVMRPIIITLMFTGMRIGEALALQWKHVDFDNKTISIRQSLTRQVDFDKKGVKVGQSEVLGTTKTQTSVRTINVPDIVIDCLKEWSVHVYKMERGKEAIRPDGFVFMSTRTMGMRTYSGFRASFIHFLERHGLEDEGVNLHRFRHTYASILLEQDVNPKVVQKLLGHRDVSTTLGIYTHVVPEVYRGVTAKVDNVAKQMSEGTYVPLATLDLVRQRLSSLESELKDS